MTEKAQNSENTPDQTTTEGTSFFNDRRLKIINWMEPKSSVLCNLYKSAVISLYSEPPKYGWPILVAYAIREITNQLPNHVADLEISDRGLNRDGEIQKIGNIWTEQQLSSLIPTENTDTPSSTDDQTRIPIPRDLFMILADLVEDNTKIEDRKYRKAYRLFKAIIPEGEFKEKDPIINEWIGVTGWFSKDGKFHVNKNKTEVGDINEYKRNFEMVENILLGAIQSRENFGQTLTELNTILNHANR